MCSYLRPTPEGSEVRLGRCGSLLNTDKVSCCARTMHNECADLSTATLPRESTQPQRRKFPILLLEKTCMCMRKKVNAKSCTSWHSAHEGTHAGQRLVVCAVRGVPQSRCLEHSRCGLHTGSKTKTLRTQGERKLSQECTEDVIQNRIKMHLSANKQTNKQTNGMLVPPADERVQRRQECAD